MAEEEVKEQPRTGGNTRLPFGLCKRYGIDLPDDATPRDAWEALAGKGITREKVYSALKKSGSTKGVKAEKQDKNKNDEQVALQKKIVDYTKKLDEFKDAFPMTTKGSLSDRQVEYYKLEKEFDEANKEYYEKYVKPDVAKTKTKKTVASTATNKQEGKIKNDKEAKAEIVSKVEKGLQESFKYDSVDKLIHSHTWVSGVKNDIGSVSFGDVEERYDYELTAKDVEEMFNSIVENQRAKEKAQKDSASEKKNANPYEGADAPKPKTEDKNSFTDKTKYKKQHDEIVDFVKEQVGVDLNKYRSGDGSSPFTTTYWEKGDKLTINNKAISREDMNRLNGLFSKGKLKKEEGGGWFWHISFGDNKTKK